MAFKLLREFKNTYSDTMRCKKRQGYPFKEFLVACFILSVAWFLFLNNIGQIKAVNLMVNALPGNFLVLWLSMSGRIDSAVVATHRIREAAYPTQRAARITLDLFFSILTFVLWWFYLLDAVFYTAPIALLLLPICAFDSIFVERNVHKYADSGRVIDRPVFFSDECVICHDTLESRLRLGVGTASAIHYCVCKPCSTEFPGGACNRCPICQERVEFITAAYK